MYKNILVVSDNEFLMKKTEEIVFEKGIDKSIFKFCYSSNNTSINPNALKEFSLSPVNLKKDTTSFIERFDLIISLHCKQIFPESLVKQVKCINVHPGFNPYNRGWYPQVFSIINGLPFGATIHEMDELVDHGPIIARKMVEISVRDTSLTAYGKALDAEIELLKDNLVNIIKGDYTTFLPEIEGNLNMKKDFADICELDLANVDSMESHINFLRALSHGDFKNAYFIDKKTGKKIYIKIELLEE